MRAIDRIELSKIEAAKAAETLRDAVQEWHAAAITVAEETLAMSMLEEVASIANLLTRLKDEAALDGDME